jgi:hypothetical protein
MFSLLKIKDDKPVRTVRCLERIKYEEKLALIIKKLRLGEELDVEEQKIADEKNLTSYVRQTEVAVDPVDVLTGVMQGDFTLQDVHLAREGPDSAALKDPVENSPLQMFEQLLESMKSQTFSDLKSKEPDQFFGTFELDASSNVSPSQINDAVKNAATAIELVQGNSDEQNEARSACRSFIMATAMSEAETKLKRVQDFNNESTARQEEKEKLAQAAAVAGALSGATSTPDSPTKDWSFDLSGTNFDISFFPSDDPTCYKPLEIISYMGMTKSAAQ